MQVNDAGVSNKAARYINLAVLMFVTGLVLFFPVKKQIWYDESVSMLCSKGLYFTVPNQLTSLQANTSDALAMQNTAAEAYKCTIIDNGNSFLYNELLHYYTNTFGNSLDSYMWLSKLCAVGVLLAIFFFCRLLWGNSIFTSLALILIGSDTIFWGMAHEIRAYELGMMLIITAAVFCYRFIYTTGKSQDLLLCGLFSVGAVLSHYLSAYAILVLVGFIVLNKYKELLRPKNIAAIAVPVVLAGAYFVSAASGFATMNRQNAAIAAKKAAHGPFAISHVITEAMRFTSGNFRFVESTFMSSTPVIVLSFAMIFGLYAAAIKLAPSRREKMNLHLLFLLGISGTLFLSALCLKSHHYTALYFRYFSFCVPFAILFTVYALYIIYSAAAVKKVISIAVVCFVMLPPVVLFARVVGGRYKVKYNHAMIARTITDNKLEKLVVPTWTDAFMVQSSLPKGFKLNYAIDTTLKDFVLIKADSVVKKVPIIRIDS
jgi:hypothetical protein